MGNLLGRKTANESLEFDYDKTASTSQVKHDGNGINMGPLSINNVSNHVRDQALNVKDMVLVSFANVSAAKKDVDSLLSLPFPPRFGPKHEKDIVDMCSYALDKLEEAQVKSMEASYSNESLSIPSGFELQKMSLEIC